jgi:hypothetical protein
VPGASNLGPRGIYLPHVLFGYSISLNNTLFCTICQSR